MIESVRLMRPGQERCIFCGDERDTGRPHDVWDCRDGYAGWIELDAPPFSDGQRARLRYLLKQ